MKISIRTFIFAVGFFVVGTGALALILAVEDHFRTALLVVTAISFLGILALVFFVIAKIIRPLRNIQRILKQIEQGNLNFSQVKGLPWEIANIQEAISQMVKELKKKEEELVESRNILQIKVQARTQELQELVDSLEERVQERTQEMGKKVRELELFRKLSVDREIKMIELKKELDIHKKSLDIHQ